MNFFKIKDSYLVLRGNAVLPAERVRAQNLKYASYESVNGATFQSFDAERSFALNLELPKDQYPNRQKDFYNALKDDQEVRDAIRKYPDYDFVYPHFIVKSEDIPQGFKNLGLRLHQKCHICKMKYDEEKRKFVLTDQDGKPLKHQSLHAEADSDTITMHTDVYGFECSDMKRLSYLYKLMHQKSMSEAAFKKSLPSCDQALLEAWNFVQAKIKKSEKQKPYSLHHEMKHIRNKFLMNQLDLCKNRGKLNSIDFCRLCEYDEKSAHLAENMKAIGVYLTQSNSDNFEMFPDKAKWLVDILKKTPVSQRKKLLANNKLLMKGTFTYWDLVHKKGYQWQFAEIVRKWAKNTPLSYYGDDVKEYQKRRSALLTIATINPMTGKEEKVDFSQYIEQDIQITPEMKKKIIATAEDIVQKRKNKLNSLGITRKIVEYVQKLHWMNHLSISQNGQDGNGR